MTREYFCIATEADYEKATKWAKAVVASYETEAKARSRSVSMLGAEKNVDIWRRSRIAEIGFCIFADLDSDVALDWNTARTDGDADVVCNGLRVDVKETRTQSLLWPLNKNSLFEKKRFDVLVMARTEDRLSELCGWVTKEEFRTHHLISPGGNGWVAGTWFMPRQKLHDMDSLMNFKK